MEAALSSRNGLKDGTPISLLSVPYDNDCMLQSEEKLKDCRLILSGIEARRLCRAGLLAARPATASATVT